MIKEFKNIRNETLRITNQLQVEDMCTQSSKDTSPAKWHLGHTSWFFEVFLLKPFLKGYKEFFPDSSLFFNSYYKSVGQHISSRQRGRMSRPTTEEILQYRNYADLHMTSLLEKKLTPEVSKILLLGINHEQQHQELLWIDIKHLLFHQIYPVILPKAKFSFLMGDNPKNSWSNYKAGVYEVGAENSLDFCFDNELPRHSVFIQNFQISENLVSNGEYLEFINDGGYKNPNFWYSDGWNWVQTQKNLSPLYWKFKNKRWQMYDLSSFAELNLNDPVTHINFYEASAYARYKNKRLPTEQEWELAAGQAAKLNKTNWFYQAWQWTSSPYQAYPGHRWERDALGEYNSKFMVNQFVLKGASLFTPKGHHRLSYRNFFYPDKKWPLTGIRLAQDAT